LSQSCQPIVFFSKKLGPAYNSETVCFCARISSHYQSLNYVLPLLIGAQICYSRRPKEPQRHCLIRHSKLRSSKLGSISS
jgi:hypothetical protein